MPRLEHYPSGSVWSESPPVSPACQAVKRRADLGRYAHMLNLVGPTSAVLFTSLSSSSVPPLKDYLSSRSASSTSSSPSATSSSSAPKEKEKAQLYTTSILDTLAGKSPPVPFSRVCLLDPRAPAELSPADADLFDVFLYGGILGDDPPRDRTGELRKLGFQGRHLGEKQMTTDTAVGVTKMVIEDGGEFDHESVYCRFL